LDENKALESLKGQNVFALELGGQNIDQFKFPEEGVVIIGSEELGVSVPFLKAADESYGRVSIPLFGSKGSLNVSVAFGILIYKWHSAVATKGKDKK
jgi:TrmH family RNA methyltransferase